MAPKRLGEYLPCAAARIEEALAQEADGRPLGRRLVEAGAITEGQLLRSLHAQRTDRLRACALFEGVPEEGLERLCYLVRERSLAADEVLFRQEERGTSFYIVVSGRVHVFREGEGGEEFPLATLEAGETVGEMGYFADGVRSASVRAPERTELLEVTYADLPRCFWAAPRLAVAFLDLVTRRLRETDVRYQEDMARRRAVERSLQRLSSMLDLSEALSMRAGIERLIEQVVRTASQVMRAERATLFLVEPATGDLWSKVAEGETTRILRVPRGTGIAGWVARTGEILHIPDAYADPRFNRDVDRRTGFRTRNILCGPVRNLQGAIIGVIQTVNRRDGAFTAEDETVFKAFAYQAAIAVENFNLYQRLADSHEKMAILLDVATSAGQTLELAALIARLVEKTTGILDCDRGSLFLLDEERCELWSMEARGAEIEEIRFPAATGLAGHTATTGEVVNVADAYDDPRFHRGFDQRTGYRTRSVLCVPVRNREQRVTGVLQAINKREGPFLAADEDLLKAMGAQVSVALDNARLHARTVEMKNYLESVQRSITNAIVALDDGFRVVTANRAAARLCASLRPGADLREALGAGASALVPLVERVYASGAAAVDYDVDVPFPGGAASVNLNVVPLHDEKGERRGAVVVLEDITREKRVKGALTRYMAKDIVDRLLQDPKRQALGGVRSRATVLFSDIRGFTTLAEGLTAEQTMDFLNEYFSLMVDEVFDERGVLDKFIGDAMLAVFGVPYEQPDDAERAARTALRMVRRLDRYNDVRRGRGEPPIRIGVGINSGEVISGNMGSEKRMDFTVIGDGVNVASRLEGLTKVYGVGILATESTRREAGARFAFRALDRVRMAGKRQPVEIYEVVGEAGTDPGPARRSFAAGLATYRALEFGKARAAFLEGAAADPPCRLFAERCDRLLREPPPADWDGVWAHATK